MSSLLNKIKTLLSAQTRRPRRHRPVTPQQEPEPAPQAQVTEAPARRRKRPQVTEASVKPEPIARADEISAPPARLAKPAADAPPPDALEESRVADLLKTQNDDERVSE